MLKHPFSAPHFDRGNFIPTPRAMDLRILAAALAAVSLLGLTAAQTSYTYRLSATNYTRTWCSATSCGASLDCGGAEFAARAVAAAGCIKGLASNSSKVAFARFMPNGGTWTSYTAPGAYNLAWTSKQNPRGAFNGLYEYLLSVDWSPPRMGTRSSAVRWCLATLASAPGVLRALPLVTVW